MKPITILVDLAVLATAFLLSLRRLDAARHQTMLRREIMDNQAAIIAVQTTLVQELREDIEFRDYRAELQAELIEDQAKLLMEG